MLRSTLYDIRQTTGTIILMLLVTLAALLLYKERPDLLAVSTSAVAIMNGLVIFVNRRTHTNYDASFASILSALWALHTTQLDLIAALPLWVVASYFVMLRDIFWNQMYNLVLNANINTVSDEELYATIYREVQNAELLLTKSATYALIFRHGYALVKSTLDRNMRPKYVELVLKGMPRYEPFSVND